VSFPDTASPVHPSASKERPRPGPATMSRRATGGSDGWCTPVEVIDRVLRIGPIGLDPCTSAENPVDAPAFYVGGKRNGLAETWWQEEALDGALAYVNPPYSQVGAWAAKVAEEAARSVEVVTLVAARPDPRWFYRLVWDSAQAVCFWRGRLTFVGAPGPAPFPSALVYHGRRPWAFEAAFQDAGKVVRLR
jgi:phage N-6-adenine-methyltransferase